MHPPDDPPGPPPHPPHPQPPLCHITPFCICCHVLRPPSIQSQHPPIRPLIRSRTRKIIKTAARRLDDVPLNKWRPFRCPLFAALNAALPLQYRPSGKIILRQLGEYRAEIHLPISRRTKPPRSIHPRLIAPVNALPPARTELRILHMKHFDPFVV